MTYAEWCKTKCEWCFAGNEVEDGFHYVEYEFRNPQNESYVKCAAPSRDQFEQELQEEIEQLEEHAAALSQKLDTLSAPLSTCGCSYDAPAHVCMVHSPQLVAANIRISELEREKTAELQEELRCITNDRDSWREQSRGHNCNLIKSRARISELEREIAELRKDKADLESLQAKNLDRFYWLFGSPDEGASRDDIEKIPMHSVGMEEALAMIDTAMQSAGEQK